MYNPYQNYLPHQQIIQVNGKSSVDTIQLAPNSSVLVMDTTAPIVWLCVSDGIGKVTSTPYDISIHQDAPPVDMASIEQRIKKLEEIINDKSHIAKIKYDKYKANGISDKSYGKSTNDVNTNAAV